MRVPIVQVAASRRKGHFGVLLHDALRGAERTGEEGSLVVDGFERREDVFDVVVWDEYGQLNAGWDTHVDHYNRLTGELLPGLDLAFSALIRDLESRGLLDDTLVLVMNEMGRTPRFEGEGRGHWGRAYSNFFAGAGLKRGNIIGRTDAIGATVADRPLTAKDVLATIYHLIGIDPNSTLNDRLNRPVPLCHDGKVIPEMLA